MIERVVAVKIQALIRVGTFAEHGGLDGTSCNLMVSVSIKANDPPTSHSVVNCMLVSIEFRWSMNCDDCSFLSLQWVSST